MAYKFCRGLRQDANCSSALAAWAALFQRRSATGPNRYCDSKAF